MKLDRHTLLLGAWGLLCNFGFNSFWLGLCVAIGGGMLYQLIVNPLGVAREKGPESED